MLAFGPAALSNAGQGLRAAHDAGQVAVQVAEGREPPLATVSGHPRHHLVRHASRNISFYGRKRRRRRRRRRIRRRRRRRRI